MATRRFLFALLLIPATIGAQPNGIPVNDRGQPVRNPDGSPINYNIDPIRAHGPAVSAPATTCAPIGASDVVSSWSYAVFGRGIGLAGLRIGRARGGTEIYVPATGTTFGPDDYFYVLRYEPATQSYAQSFVSPCFGSPIARIGLGDVIGDGHDEIVIALASGEVVLYDQDSKKRLTSFLTAPEGLNAMALKDLDGDGKDEILLLSATNLYVYSGTGSLLWQVNGVGGYDVAAGQMDSDPALEIVTTSGAVIDSGTHAIQWQWPSGFGAHLAVADIDGDGIEELIAAEAWYFVWAYDVDRQLPKWSIPIAYDIGAILMADVDCDGVPELLVGQGQWGSVQVFDPRTQALKWQIPNPEHGVTNIAVGDVDGNGILDVLWGAGATSTGPDHLYVADVQTKTIRWSNADLVGPFVGPEIGDVDGDGRLEAVVVTWSSNAGYDSGRILVFDAETMHLRAVSDPVVSNSAWTGVHDLRLRNVDSDPELEIVIAAGYLYDGAIEIYDFDGPTNAFTLKWTNATRPYGATFYSVEISDLKGDGHRKVICGAGREHTGALGVFVYVYDLDTNTEDWHTFQLGSYWSRATGLQILSAGGGDPDIVALVDSEGLYVFDGVTQEPEQIISGSFTALTPRPGSSRSFLAGDAAGNVIRYDRSGTTYVAGPTWHPVADAIDGITLLAGGAIGIGAGGRMRVFPSFGAASSSWQSAPYGPPIGWRAAVGPGFFSRILTGGPDSLVALTPPLSLTSIAPKSGSGTTTVTVLGSGFSAPLQLFFGTTAASSVAIDSLNQIHGDTPGMPAGSLVDVTVLNGDGSLGSIPDAFFADFTDVAPTHLFHDFIEALVRSRITAGCGSGLFCPGASVTRAQMAVFLLSSRFTENHVPPPATGTLFSDVGCNSFAASYIEELARLGISAGCGSGQFCPSLPITRAQAAVFLLRTKYGLSYNPPPATGTVFADVPATGFAAAWIEELAAEGISAGCGGGLFCPQNPITRGQMAVFLSLTFSLV